MNTLATNVEWGTAPTNLFDFEYESKREGGSQHYRLRISCQPCDGASYFGYPIYLEISLDGATLNTYTLKTASPKRWSESIIYTTDWLAVDRTSGLTALVIRIYSGMGSSRNNRYNYELPIDPVTSSVTATDAYIGSTSTIIINRAHSALRHTIAYQLDGEQDYTIIATLTDQVTVGWTIPESTYALIPESPSVGVTIICDTYDGDILLGSNTCRMTARCDPELCAPAVKLNAEDVLPETVALTGNCKCIVERVSKIRATVEAEARNGAELATINYDFGDFQINVPATELSCDKPLAASATVAVRVTDSRGLSTTVEVSDLVLIPYRKAYGTIDAIRVSPTSSEVDVTVIGQCWQGDFGIIANNLTVRARAKEQGNEVYSDWVTLTVDQTDHRFTATGRLSELDYNKLYTIEAEIKDALTSDVPSTKLMRGTPLFDWGESDFRHRTVVILDEGARISNEKTLEMLRSDGTRQARIRSSAGVDIASFDESGNVKAMIAISDTGAITIAGEVTIAGSLNVNGQDIS